MYEEVGAANIASRRSRTFSLSTFVGAARAGHTLTNHQAFSRAT